MKQDVNQKTQQEHEVETEKHETRNKKLRSWNKGNGTREMEQGKWNKGNGTKEMEQGKWNKDQTT